MELPEGKPELVISHSLKNTGTKAINTQQYNHNFFSIDNDYIGRNYQLNLFFPAKYETVHPKQFREKMNRIRIEEEKSRHGHSYWFGQDESSERHSQVYMSKLRKK